MTLALRFPSPGFPADLATGDARIDAHLVALDAALVGAKCTRNVPGPGASFAAGSARLKT